MRGFQVRSAPVAAALIGLAIAGFSAMTPAAVAAPSPRPIVGAVHGTETTPGVLRVVVQGAGFTHVKRVVVAGTSATQVRVASPQKLEATIVDLGRGFGDVQVFTTHGTSPGIPADRIVLGPLRTATHLVAHPSAHSVRLTWAVQRQGVTGIVVRRGTKSFPRNIHQGIAVPGVRAGSSSVVDKHLTSVTTYRYSVFVQYAGRGYAHSFAHARAKTHAGSTTVQVVVGALITLALLIAVRLARVGTKFLNPPNGPNDKKGVLTGGDNRGSTSKSTLLLWTVVLVFFLITMALLAGFSMTRYTSLVGTTDHLYLVLIGGPFAAAVTANVIVNDRLHRDPAAKSKALKPRALDILHNDNGDTDVVDTQYVLFNVVVAATVIVQFVHSPLNGPPHIAGFLASLLGVSAATYTASKGVRSTT